MEFSNPAQFDRAIKRAIREFGVDPGDGYRQMLRDRFLCRVFSSSSGRFILKGGSGMLARIPDARATRDIDFATAGRKIVLQAAQRAESWTWQSRRNPK